MKDNQINKSMWRNKMKIKMKLLLLVKNKLVNYLMRRLIVVETLLTCLLGIVSRRRLPHLLARRVRRCKRIIKEKKEKKKNK